jgi:hypothetical protein
MQHDVDIANVQDAFNISLSTADCVKNLGNDITRIYLPASVDNVGLNNLFKSFKIGEELVCYIFICVDNGS